MIRKIRKHVLFNVIGQSNEAGTCYLATGVGGCQNYKPRFGNPHDCEYGPHTNTTWWGYCAELLAKQVGVWAHFRVNAVGGTSCVADWCGYNATSGAVYAPGDAGYDPNGYIAATESDFQSQPITEYHEAWWLMEWGQNDAALPATAAQYQAAYETLATRAFAVGAHGVVMAQSVDRQGAETWYDTVGWPATQASVASMQAQGKNVLLGPSLKQVLGDYPYADLYNGIHVYQNASIDAGLAWARSLIEMGIGA